MGKHYAQNNTLQVMTRHKQIINKDFTYTLLGANVPTHLHIDNHETKYGCTY